MEPNQQQYTPEEGRPLLQRFDTQKILYILFGILLLLIIVAIVIVTNNRKNESKIQLTPTPSIKKPTSIPTPSISLQIREIQQEAKPQIDNIVNGMSYNIDKTVTFEESWAIMQISNQTTDTAWVVVKRENNEWKVVYGPGTRFPADKLRSLGAPQSLIDASNKPL